MSIEAKLLETVNTEGFQTIWDLFNRNIGQLEDMILSPGNLEQYSKMYPAVEINKAILLVLKSIRDDFIGSLKQEGFGLGMEGGEIYQALAERLEKYGSNNEHKTQA